MIKNDVFMLDLRICKTNSNTHHMMLDEVIVISNFPTANTKHIHTIPLYQEKICMTKWKRHKGELRWLNRPFLLQENIRRHSDSHKESESDCEDKILRKPREVRHTSTRKR